MTHGSSAQSQRRFNVAYSWEPPERSYEDAKLIAQAIKNAR